jgi:5-methylcytosine-specific restriction protein B
LPKDEANPGDWTLPQLLARHRDSKSCAACHRRFDSVGLVFEGFGPVGERRTKDLGGRPVQTAATFPDGKERSGLDGLRDYLREKRQNDCIDNLCRKLFSCAPGRSLQLSDQKALEAMRTRLASDGFQFGSLVEAIVTSPQFRNKRGRDDPAEPQGPRKNKIYNLRSTDLQSVQPKRTDCKSVLRQSEDVLPARFRRSVHRNRRRPRPAAVQSSPSLLSAGRRPGTLMSIRAREPLPLAPLLHAYTRAGVASPAELHRLPDLGPRFAAVLSATAKFLCDDFLDRASDADLADSLGRFYEACVRPPLHGEALRRRAGFVRHGLAYLLRGRDPLEVKAEACLGPSGPYRVAGLGPQFWSALLQATRPARNPGWTPATLAGLMRLGLVRPRPGDGPGSHYASLMEAYARIAAVEPALSALHVDHFLTLVAGMSGRHLFAEAGQPTCPIAAAIGRERRRLPLRDLLKERGPALASARENLEAALARGDGKAIGDALAVADPAGAGRSPLDWGAHAETLTLWVERLWKAEDPYPLLAEFWTDDPLPGAGLWLPAAVLHLRDPQRFGPWDETARLGYAALDDSDPGDSPAAERYRLFNEGVAWLRSKHALHPLEAPAVLAALAPGAEASGASPKEDAEAGATFGGFCADTFHFLGELAYNNRREWMERQRGRYRFAVREPLVELCRALAGRYVVPVLGGVHGWDLDVAPRSGRALTSVCKNAYGRSQPYNTALWIAFSHRTAGGPRDGVQFFVRVDAQGVRYGVRLGRKARAAARRFRGNLQRHAELLFRVLHERGAPAACTFGSDEDGETHPLAGAADLREWAAGRTFAAWREQPAEAPLLHGDELVGEVLLTFDRLVPLFACAVEEDAGAFLARCLRGGSGEGYTEADFRHDSFLSGDWLARARGLLDLKRQLILQGVPGTGKTHVARCLARLLTAGRPGAVRLVQFHPTYSYEEFVEGIKVRSVAVDGRHDVTYPVEDGLLCAFAAEAARHPSDPYVLIVDEINRGNLPRIFGELLYLLEYRDHAVTLPYSRRGFRLPANLYLLGTMNAADRSVALVDQALRRRFSFVDMVPDAGVLSAWLSASGTPFAARVLALFERLNARLRADLGPQGQVGHSYFMVPDLDEQRLRVVWQHHVRPLLEEHFAGRPERLAAYDLDRLLDGRPRRRAEAVST